MRSRATPTAVTLVLLGISCGATIHSSVAPDTDLSRYRTYQLYTPTYRQGQPETIADQAIVSALKQDLAAKGLVEATSTPPDFLVAYHVRQQQELDVNTVGYGFMGWPGTDVSTYTQGTLIVDFIEPQSRQVFWRGSAVGVVDHPASPNVDKIEKVVGQIVKRYPSNVAQAPRTTM